MKIAEIVSSTLGMWTTAKPAEPERSPVDAAMLRLSEAIAALEAISPDAVVMRWDDVGRVEIKIDLDA